MTILNEGKISLNRILTNEALKAIRRVLVDDHSYIIEDISSSIIIEGYYSASFDRLLIKLIRELKPMGYVVNGEISYCGDVSGKIVVKNNHVRSSDLNEVSLLDATTEELAALLEKKGLIVDDIVKSAIRKSIPEYEEGSNIESNNLIGFYVCVEYFEGIVEAYIESIVEFDGDIEHIMDEAKFDSVMFIVPKKWLKNYLKNSGIENPKDYLINEYTSDDSIEWYEEAIKQKQIVAVSF